MLFAGMLAFTSSAAGAPEVGEKAPAFSLKGSDGKTYSTGDFKGKQAMVIAWFPKAFTGGCTAECKSLRESGKELAKFDVAYFAASCDDEETNAKFAESLDLDYPILCDPERDAAMDYGLVKNEKGNAKRHTIYIGKDGKILFIDEAINTKSAGADVAAKLLELGVEEK